MKTCKYCGMPIDFEYDNNTDVLKIAEEKGFDIDKLRLSIGGGSVRYSNCLNLELIPGNKKVDGDIFGDIRKGVKFIKDDTFHEVLLIHVIEHIERKYHQSVLDEIWRILRPGCRFIMGYPEFTETAKHFIENKYGGRWKFYNPCVYGRQSYPGDYHVTAMEVTDISDRLISSGFVNLNIKRNGIDTTIICRKGEKLNYL